ncbi:MAG: SDR family NAD(P)-dependent oxidoreductase [Paracoccaceae bacterium]
MTQTLLITGAGRGIGLEMARQAVARGDRVLATVRKESSARALQGIAAQVLLADVTDEEALSQAAAAVETEIDLLSCNAGIYRGRGGIDADDMAADAWQSVLMTNIAGPFLVLKAFLPKIKAPGGKFTIISSAMGSSASAPGGSYIYRSSKAGATNLACNLASDLRPHGIAVGSYHPGWVRTDMGGSSASISVEESASGLLSRFDALGIETTGVFEDYAGVPIAF